ncbi:MAG: sigma-E processing peptidase SpoIIGA [Lawsonibacter sp.]|nr:sigma-E processing peptidase SpoIIGA [Lawsonibacter sp.]
MTVIYIDTLFLLNAAVDYLLLLAAARLAGEPLRRCRFALGAVLGGVYAAAIFLPGLGFLSHPLCRVCSLALMLVAAYGGSRRLLRQGLLFVALTCALGGGVVAIGLLGGTGLTLGHGVFYSALDIKVVLLSAAVCYGVLTLAFQRLGKHSAAAGELVAVKLRLGERSVALTALVDTGNTLTDPASGRPVVVAEGARLAALFPPDCRPGPAELADPASALTRLGVGEWRARFRLLPYRSVGVDRGLLLAVRTDVLEVAGQGRGGVLVALSPTPVSDGGGYQALIGAVWNCGGDRR